MLKSCSKNWKYYATCGLVQDENHRISDFQTKTFLNTPKQQHPPSTKITPFSVNFHIPENSSKNNTSEYEICETDKNLVARRGNKIHISIKFNRGYKIEFDDMFLVFSYVTGNIIPEFSPTRVNGTLVRLKVKEELERETQAEKEGEVSDSEEEANGENWFAELENFDEEMNEILVSVQIPFECVIGKWKLSIECTSECTVENTAAADSETEKNHLTSKFDCPTPLYIIFNPYSFKDQTFLPDPLHRKEYLESEVGLIYRGSPENRSSKTWNYQQFDMGILEASINCLLENEQIKNRPFSNISKLAKPEFVTRILSNAVHKSILVGNWSGEYKKGKSPLSWNGSGGIIKNSVESGAPTKFGQCWVFSGVVTTVCRSLGVPCRSVTGRGLKI